MIKIALSLFILFLYMFPQDAPAQDVKKIVLLPFDIYSKTNTVLLQESVYKGIASELTKPKHIQLIDRNLFLKTIEGKRVDEKVAISAGKVTGANYVIMGSLSEIGEQISVDVMRAMIDDEGVFAHRRRALTPDRPVLRGTAQNPDVFFQARESCNPFYDACAETTQKIMDKFAGLTGQPWVLLHRQIGLETAAWVWQRAYNAGGKYQPR
jgi:TolB-like protein